MKNDPLFHLALTKVPGIGNVQAKLLLAHFEGDAEAIFKAKKKTIATVEGIGDVKAKAIKAFEDFKSCEEEIVFCNKHHIQILYTNHSNYPQRLLHCYDAPTVLFYRGNAGLNTSKVVSIIGTRTNSDYGKQVTEQLIAHFKEQNITVISGLAFGIDAIAHKAALKNSLPTLAVLAHGMHTIYPVQHKLLAKDILLCGGLLTEFCNGVKASRHNFPKRNRIVAGLSDATIVIETAIKGGSMITAELAYHYNRDVFAVPGKLTDYKSSGCLALIRQNKAVLYTSPDDFMREMGWIDAPKLRKAQKELFIEISEEEQRIVELLQKKDSLHIDEIYLQSGLSSSIVASCILNLELNNIIATLPGKLYKLV
ncbi:MAG: DNA-processing protein DprA [Sphingobacteriia bacterium]|nr:DNA-processing protein DprA [Sphingobacteriia bacterium]